MSDLPDKKFRLNAKRWRSIRGHPTNFMFCSPMRERPSEYRHVNRSAINTNRRASRSSSFVGVSWWSSHRPDLTENPSLRSPSAFSRSQDPAESQQLSQRFDLRGSNGSNGKLVQTIKTQDQTSSYPKRWENIES